ncbi:hypothetical protein ACRWE4_22860, partial [Escherichia coli]
TLKMPAFEWVHVQLHQQKGMISLSPPTICNSALKPTLLQTVENILQTLSMLFQLTGRLIDVKALVSGSAVAKNV